MGSYRSWLSTPRFSLSDGMRAIALCALIAAIATQSGVFYSVILLAVVLLPFLILYLGIHSATVLPVLRGRPCPGCGERALGRIAVVSFGPRFYRCETCGARLKRPFLGGRWCEVKSTREHALYEPKARAGPWGLDAWHEEDDINGSKTIDSLIHNQRRRHWLPSRDRSGPT